MTVVLLLRTLWDANTPAAVSLKAKAYPVDAGLVNRRGISYVPSPA